MRTLTTIFKALMWPSLNRSAWLSIAIVGTVIPIHTAMAAPGGGESPGCTPVDEGNPYKQAVLDKTAELLKKPLQKYTDGAARFAWSYRDAAEDADFLARASHLNLPADVASQARQHASELIDLLLSVETDDGRWWSEQSKNQGDGNVNRFVLGAALEALYYLSYDAGNHFNKDPRISKLQSAVELQRKLYNGMTEKGWPANGYAGQYVNQDVYYVLIAGLWERLANDNEFDDQRTRFLNSMRTNLMPDGGWHYIDNDVESPIYHVLNTVILAHYYCVSHDQAALDQLAKTAKYWKLVTSPAGDTEYWSDVWWKQGWQALGGEALEVAAAASNDPQLYALRQPVNARPDKFQLPSIFLMSQYEWWRPAPAGTPATMQVPVMQADHNINGYRYTSGNLSLGLMLGHGLRDTFVGGMVSDASQAPYSLGVIRAIALSTTGKDGKELWLSQPREDAGSVELDGNQANLCVKYALQPSLLDGFPPTQIKSREWLGEQAWGLKDGNLLGALALLHGEEASSVPGGAAKDVLLKLFLGPGEVRPLGNGLFQNGQLKILVTGVDGDSAQMGQGPTSPLMGAPKWPILSLKAIPDSQGRYSIGVWIGTKDAPALKTAIPGRSASVSWGGSSAASMSVGCAP